MGIIEPLKTPLASSHFHIQIDRAALLKVLGHCQGVVERRNTVPILSHILLEAKGETIKVVATDLEVSFAETIPAIVKGEGSVTVSSQLFYDIVRKLQEGAEIELSVSENQSSLHLRCSRSQFHLPTLPVTDFPIMKPDKFPHQFSIRATKLTQLIDCTRFAMSTEETRYYLNGIYFHATQDGFLRVVATDGHRLAQTQTEIPEAAKAIPGVIISRKTINEIRKLLDELDVDVQISLSEAQIMFSLESAVLVSRLIEGTFPDYERVIPSTNDQKLDVEVSTFAEAVDRVSLMSTDKMRPIKLKVDKDLLTLTAHSGDAGSAEEQLEISYSGSPVDLGFNAKYILDVTQHIKGDKLRFLMGDGTQAVIAKDPEDVNSLYVLMPLRV